MTPLLKRLAVLLCTIILFSAGCVKPNRTAPQDSTPYLPPTIVPSPVPTKTAARESAGNSSSQSQAGGSCTDVLKYVQDLTIPDGTAVTAGSTMDKRWEVENAGTCNWDEKYKMHLVAGPDLGAASEQPLFPARSGSRAEIRMIFTAPSKQGAYRSAWQAYNPAGTAFGDPIYIDFVVGNP